MRLGILTHKLIKGDGQGRVNYEIARAALDRGHQAVLLASEVAPELAAHPAVTWVHLPVSRWPTELVRNQIFAWRSSGWLRAHHVKLDLILANGCITWYPADVNAVHFVHSAWMRSPVHTARLHRGPYGWYQWVYTTVNAAWERHAFKQAGLIVAVSDQVRDDLVRMGVAPDQIQVIPNGVDHDEFSPGGTDRTSLGLPGGVVLGVFIGDIRTPRKNLDSVLKALQFVPALHLAVVGEVEGSPYPQMARRLNVHDRVHFLGYRLDVADIMRACDVCICPSRHEPFSLVLLEALATGLPVVTARAVGAAQLVDSDCGIILDDPEDDAAMAAALGRLVVSRTLRSEMGRAARAKAECHSWGEMAGQYLCLFEQLSEGVSGGGTIRGGVSARREL
ncbi:MAG TPA: glycosyltransferase family 4 protein [Rhodothermales bacterium]|nr:glycosyltransferase family 4 protein [Rhodothermales bacterium]